MGKQFTANKHKIHLLPLILVLALFVISGCSRKVPVEKESFLMDTVIQIKAYGKNAGAAADKALERVSELEKKLTIHADDSEVIRLNKNAGIAKVQVSEDAFRVLGKAVSYAQKTNGSFDPTIGPLVRLWGIGTENARIPSRDEIQKATSLIDYNSLALYNDGGYFAELKKTGQIVDLGGIAKGDAGDQMIQVLKEFGIESAFVNLGGNVVALGKKPDGTPWKIGIQNPLSEVRGSYIGILEVINKTVVTSGNYERFFIKDGVRYHHILDPKTGYPSENGLISVTIVTDRSIDADGLSTSAYVLGLEKGMELIKSIPGTDAIFVSNEKKVYITPGIEKSFKITDGDFVYEKR